MDETQVRQIIREEFVKQLGNLIASDRFVFQKNLQLMDGRNIQLGKTTGTKIGTETTQKLGFFNKAPIVQQTTTSQTAATFAANTSGIVDDTATWDSYTIGDIVAILRAFGLLA